MMLKNSRIVFIGVFMLASLAFSGCTLGSNSPNNPDPANDVIPAGGNTEPETEPGAAVGETSTESSLCANPYIPVINGASWTYASSSSDAAPYTFTDNVTAASGAGYTLYSEFDALTKSQTWACSDEGLVAMEYSGSGQASVTTSGMTATFETTDMSGITFPNEIAVGDSWSQSFTVSGTNTLDGGMTSETTGTVQIEMTAVDVEEVSVTAGSFDAIRIEVQTTLDFMISIDGGVSVPFLMSSSGFTWLVEGVGWVKTESTYSMMGMAGSETLELISYSIPE